MVASSLVFEIFSKLEKPWSITNLSSAIEHLYNSTKNPTVLLIEFSANTSRFPHWYTSIGKRIRKYRQEIELHLSKRLNEKLRGNCGTIRFRIGVVDNKIYLWYRNTGTSFINDPRSWINLYRNERFHFRTCELKRFFVDEACRYLHTTYNGLSRLISQITDYPNKIPRESAIMDLRVHRTTMHGEVISFLLDVTGMSLIDISSNLADIGTGASGDVRLCRGCGRY